MTLQTLKQTAAEGIYVTTISTPEFRALIEIAEAAISVERWSGPRPSNPGITTVETIRMDRLRAALSKLASGSSWRCGKCDREALGIFDDQILRHSPRCPKRAMGRGNS